MKTNIVTLISDGVKLDEFNADETLALLNGYMVKEDMLEIVGYFTSPHEKLRDPEQNTILRDQLERINLVYDVYKKAIKLYPNDINYKHWNDIVEKTDRVIYGEFKLR